MPAQAPTTGTFGREARQTRSTVTNVTLTYHIEQVFSKLAATAVNVDMPGKSSRASCLTTPSLPRVTSTPQGHRSTSDSSLSSFSHWQAYHPRHQTIRHPPQRALPWAAKGQMNNQTVVTLLWTTLKQIVSLSTVLLGWLRHDRQQAVATDGQEHFAESFFFSTWSNAQLCRKVQLVSRACSRTARSRRKKVEEPCRSYRLTDEHTESGACTTFTATHRLPDRTHVCRSRKVLCGIRSKSSYYVL